MKTEPKRCKWCSKTLIELNLEMHEKKCFKEKVADVIWTDAQDWREEQ
jgi:phage FluMu protein Com